MRSKPFTLLLLLMSFALVGSRSNCDNDPPNASCSPIALSLDPGECAPFQNTCGSGGWVRLDSLRACDAPPGVTFHVARKPRTRSICVAQSASPGIATINTVYTAPSVLGQGSITLTVNGNENPLIASASATPSTIVSGESSQLDGVVTGGTPPYTYAWSPPFFLSATDIANPVATPPFSITYVLNVSDANFTVQAFAPINVGFGVDVAATPSSIAIGETSALDATPLGGTPPFSYSWAPSGSLDDATLQSPTASPTNTTTYDVTVTDGGGKTASGMITVAVAMQALASASPDTISTGQSSTLDVSVAGGVGPYSYDWAPSAFLDDATRRSPTATPLATTIFDVLVTDSTGAQASSSVDVLVQGSVVDAQLVVEAEPLRLFLDGSFSTGPITEYRWWCDYAGPGQPPDDLTPTPFSQCDYASPGPALVRLEVRDASAPPNVDFVEQAVNVP